MASDLISRKALLKAMVEVEEKLEECMCVPSWATAIKCIGDFPTVDAAPVVRGEWIKHKRDPEVMRFFHEQGIGKGMSENSIFWTCSECKSWGTPVHNYCQNCGAKMDGG